MNAMLGLKEFVCDLVEQSWAVMAELCDCSAGTERVCV